MDKDCHEELLPLLPKAMPCRPQKARRKKTFEPKKSKTKLSRHGRDMHCGIYKSSDHFKRSCSSKADALVKTIMITYMNFNDQLAGKAKGSKKKRAGSSGSSLSMNDKALARLMVSELAIHNECAIAMKKE
ncbi:hypothetical protein Tco_0467677 [Tanacetum coccineum]